jgi:Flp pilus assembly pilin Flp
VTLRRLFHRILAGLADPQLPDRGQGLAEYALILVLIAVVAVLSLIVLGGQLSKMLSNVGHSV